MTADELLAAARALVPLAARTAEESERARRLVPEMHAAVRDAGLFRMCVPRLLGGAELPPHVLTRVVEELAAADGATSWCVMIGATSGVVAGHLAEDVGRDVFGASTSVTVGPFAPLGKARVDNDGYRLSGRWPYVSMSQDATWFMAGTVVEAAQRRLLLFPAGRAKIHDTWSVTGLCATGSHDIEVDDELVPQRRSVSLGFDQPVADGPLYVFPVLGLLSAGIASVALGIARGAITDLIHLASNKTPTYAVRRLSERPLIQVDLARAEADLRAARAFLAEAIEEAWCAAKERRLVDLRQRATLRLAAAHATTAAARVIDTMYTAGGGTSVYRTSPLQRRMRDVHTATQHVMVGPAVLELVGRVMLGLKVEASTL